MALTRPQRNKIFEVISASALDPAECSISERGNEVEIRHSNSGSTFTFRPAIVGVMSYSVTYYVYDGNSYSYDTAHNIGALTPNIRVWADEIKQIFEHLTFGLNCKVAER